MAAPSRDLDRFLVRMPDGMRQRLAEVAKANGRSMNSEIVARLEASFDTLMTPGMHKVLDAMLEELERRKNV